MIVNVGVTVSVRPTTLEACDASTGIKKLKGTQQILFCAFSFLKVSSKEEYNDAVSDFFKRAIFVGSYLALRLTIIFFGWRVKYVL